MRNGNRHFWSLMLLLTLGVALREAPEIVTLSDDWTNEGLVVEFGNQLPKLITHRLPPREAVYPSASLPSRFINLTTGHSWFGPSLTSSSRSGQDILRFVCLLRK